MTIWEFVNNTASVATLLTFPVGIAGGIAIFAAWSNKTGRVFAGAAIMALVVLFGADIAIRAKWIGATLIDVHDRIFRNERVMLDGHSYRHCQFYNVTFVINGTAPVHMVDDDIYGGFLITSDSPQIQDAIFKLNGLGFIKFPV